MEFPLRRQGYDRDMVDAFLTELADRLQAQAETDAAEAVFLQVDGGFKSLMQMAAEKAERTRAEAEAEVARARVEVEREIDEAREASARLREEAEMVARAAEAEAEETVARAERDAAAHKAAAESEANVLLSEARSDAAHVVNLAQERVEHLRMVERSVIDCLSRAGSIVDEAKAWLGADEDTDYRADPDMVELPDDPVGAYEAAADGGDPGPDSPDRHPEWAPPWWSQPEDGSRAPSTPGNGHSRDRNGH